MKTLMLLLLLVVVGGAVGYLAGPFLARAHPTVQLAARIRLEDSEKLDTRTLESEALRNTGRPVAELYTEARAVGRRMALGAALFGAWCGLVVGLKFCLQSRIPRRDIYEIDHARCVDCARCFIACPRERLRLKELHDSSPGGVT